MNTVNVKEVNLRPLVAEDTVADTVKDRHQEGDRVTGLVDLVVLKGLDDQFDAALSAEELLIFTLFLADA